MSRKNLLLILLGFIYYFFFVNKGIILYDEGYYFHISDRILQGQIPYKDFFLQFPPGYFYLLSLILKVFGEQILVGRFFTLFICLCILFLELKISEKLGLSKIYQKVLIFLTTISFGFPLINNPATLAWIIIFASLLLSYSYILWFKNQNIKYLLLIGLYLGLCLFIKQNIGLYFLVVTNIFVFLSLKRKFSCRIISLLIVNLPVIIINASWIYYFFLKDNFSNLINFIDFNRRYGSIYPLSYPSLSFIFQPLGIFKLIPYYSPFILIGLLIYSRTKKIDWPKAFFVLIALVGFFGTVLPTSDLLHVYPFYGSILISGLIFFSKTKFYKFWIVLTIISIFIGFYLTLFKEYYRYQPSYILQNTKLDLPRTQGIEVDKPLAESLKSLYYFIQTKSSKNSYVLSYPFSPMLYFILNRNNPSKYSIYYPGYLTNEQEKTVIDDLKNKKVKYIITRSEYKFNTPLSKFIQSKKNVYSNREFNIFEIN